MRLIFKNQVYNTENENLIAELKERGFVEETEKQTVARIRKESATAEAPKEDEKAGDDQKEDEKAPEE